MPKLYYKSGSSWVNALNIFYPVGAFYISNVSTSPATLLGGTWAQVTNAAIRGASSTGYTGSDSTTLTTSQIPSHSHGLTQHFTYGIIVAATHAESNLGFTTGSAGGWAREQYNPFTVNNQGGGNRTPIFSVPTIATFGTALPKRGWC